MKSLIFTFLHSVLLCYNFTLKKNRMSLFLSSSLTKTEIISKRELKGGESDGNREFKKKVFGFLFFLSLHKTLFCQNMLWFNSNRSNSQNHTLFLRLLIISWHNMWLWIFTACIWFANFMASPQLTCLA